MQVFEFHFNPKLKEEQIFDSFVYEPENVYEKKLGSIYLIGELQNTLPQNLKLLDSISNVIKKNYYALSFKSPEKALSQTLSKTNDFLADQVKNENVSWLGNLNLALLSIKDLDLFFTKTGEMKILLIRAGQIIDIGKSLDIQEIEPYPLKIFFNIVSGKLAQDDIILVLTKGVFDFFQQQNILTKIALAEKINSKTIKEILPNSLFTKGEGAKVSGICFLAVIGPALPRRTILFQRDKKFQFPRLKLPKIRLPKIKLPKIKVGLIEKFKPETNLKKKLILVLILACLLLFGFLIFKKRELKRESETKISSVAIEELEKINKLEKIENPQEVSEIEYKTISSPFTPPENLAPLPDFNLDLSAFYLSNIYFLDKKTCKIVKYPYLGESSWGLPQIWKETDAHCKNPKSMAIDSSIWLLNGDNSLLRYHKGVYQETLSLDIFPALEDITKIEAKANIPYLYLLEPLNKRVIVITKTGEIIRQFQSEKFDNLTDLAISEDAKTIYLKNNSNIYKIEM